jgi:general secretion pathway protein D
MKTSVQLVLVVLFAAPALFANAEGRQEETSEARGVASNSSGTKPNEVSLPIIAFDTIKLQLNFQNVAVDVVLDYLSAAGHLIIHKETNVRGSIDLQSKEAATTDQAVELMNAALKRLGCTIIRDGRILTVASLDRLNNVDLDVVTGNDPNSITKSDQLVTQIIPVRYATASQLVNNLQLLLPTTASLSVNESANALILVATKTQIRRMLRIVNAIDISMARVLSIRVIPLRYADAKQLATVVQQLFSTQSSTQNGGATGPFNFPGGFGPPGFGGPPGATTSSDSSSGPTSASKVVAVADEQSNSLIVSATSDRLETLVRMVKEVDQPVADVTEIRLFTLQNADPEELADQLAALFSDGTQQRSGQNQSPTASGGPPQFVGGGGGPGGFGGGPGGPGGGPGGFFAGGGNVTDPNTSQRSRKQSQVISVADPRTSSLLVSAAAKLMPQIAKMIEELDGSPARKEIVQVYELHNADPQDISPILQSLFNRNSATRNNNTSDRSSLLGQGNPLTTRETEQQNGATSQTSGFGNSSGRGAAGQGGSGSGGF